MPRLQAAKNSPRPLVRQEATEAINMQGGKNAAPAKPKAPKSPINRFVNKGAKMAHKDAVSHFADATIRGALNQHTAIQNKAR